MPYICPVEDCDVPNSSYGSIEEWTSHLYRNHSQTEYWRCPACNERTRTSNDFVHHVRQNHGDIVASDLLDDFAESCKQSELVPLTCPICGDNSDCTLDLIGEHTHKFFLSSLPSLSINLPSIEQRPETASPLMENVFPRARRLYRLPSIALPSHPLPSMPRHEPSSMWSTYPHNLESAGMPREFIPTSPIMSSSQPLADISKESHDSAYRTDNISFTDLPGAKTLSEARSETEPRLSSTIENESSKWKSPARILCLDGGGVRGLSTLMILRRIMDKIADDEGREHGSLRPCDYFDFICGTGTGGIIAILVGRLKLTVNEAIEKYISLSQDVFEPSRTYSGPWSSIRRIRRGIARFDAKILEKKIKEILSSCNGETEWSRMYEPLRAGDRRCHAAVVAVSAGRNKNRMLRLSTSYDRDDNCKIWEAARATSAAPVFFDPIKIGSPPITYSDDKMSFNNPARVTYEEVQRLWPHRRIGVFLSLGTGQQSPQSIRRNKLVFGIRLEAEVTQALVKMSESATKVHDQLYAQLRAHNNDPVYFRFNVDQGLADIGLQEWQKTSQLASCIEAYMARPEISHAYLTCTASIRRIAARMGPVMLPASVFHAKHEENLDTDHAAQGI